MKRLSLFKAVSVVTVVAMLLLSTTGVFAAVTAVQDPTSTKVVVKGSFEGTDPTKPLVAISISEQEDAAEFIAAGQAVLNADGTFSADIYVSDDVPYGEYVVQAVPDVYKGEKAETVAKFYYAHPDSKLDALKEVVAETDAEALVVKIESYKDLLDIDTDLWDGRSDAAKKAAAEQLIEDLADYRKGSVSISDLPNVLDTINGEVYTQGLNDSSIESIDEITKYVESEYIEELEGGKISSAGVARVEKALVGSNIKDYESLKKELDNQIFIAGVVNPADDNVQNSKYFIETYGEKIGLTSIDDYNKLATTNQKLTVAKTVKESDARTFAALDEAFTAAVNANSGGTPTNNPGGSAGNPSTVGSTTVVVKPSPSPAAESNTSYVDIVNVPWAHEAINQLSSRGIIAGHGDGIFAPDNLILREEFIKIAVVGLYGAGAVNMSSVPSYTDVQEGWWYVPYIAAAENKGITSGIGDGLFGTGMQITRQDVAVMLYRMLRASGVGVEVSEYNFTDKADIADYAQEAVYALKSMGIISGYDDGSFQPNGQTTRAEAAVLLYKTLSALGKIIR